ncbi:MAG: ChaN family lipoprotein [Aquificaceae bacterium]
MFIILFIITMFLAAKSAEASKDILDKYHVIFIPEEHTNEEDHRFQLEVIKYLHLSGYKILIAMEMFQQPFQVFLDQYISCQIDEGEMLKKTEYAKRWGFDPALYRDIWMFAKERAIRIVAINIPSELVQRIRRDGLERVRGDESLPHPIIDLSEKERQSLRDVLASHPKVEEKRFFDIQKAWDNGMALAIARLLEEYPEYKVVVLVGKGHADEYDIGIPRRLKTLKPEVNIKILKRDQRDFLFSIDFSKDSSSANSIKEPNCKP